MSAAIGTHQVADVLHSDALVVFGFTGDLANKKIFPALYAMVKKRLLTVPIIGVASSKLSTQDLCLRVRESLIWHRPSSSTRSRVRCFPKTRSFGSIIISARKPS